MFIINGCGYNSHHMKPCDIEHPYTLTNYLLLLVKTEAWFMHGNHRETIPPNSVLLFAPATYVRYGCDVSDYNDDWLHFLPSGEDCALFNQLQFPIAQILTPFDAHKISHFLRLISDSYHSPSLYQEEILSSLVKSLLLTLSNELNRQNQLPRTDKHFSELDKLRTRIYNNPSASWKIEQMASSLCLSVSHFQHLYKNLFGCSCQQDIIHARLEMARRYLTNTDMSIHYLAEFCGYQNELHFMRQFKKNIGVTPSEYRRHSRSIS